MADYFQRDSRKDGPEAKARQGIQVSIIIPTLNEEKVLGRCLAALRDMDFPRDCFEILVVDNGSSDGTLQIAESYGDSLNIRILRKPGVHIAALRNFGASEASGEILAFLDADCLPPQNWLRSAARYLADSEHDIVGAHYGLSPDSTWVGRIWHEDRESHKLGEVDYLPSGDLILRRDAFSRLNGFDESIQTNEDFEFCQRALKAGLRIWSFAELRVIHLGLPQTIAHFFRKNRWHGKHVLRVFLRNLPDLHNLVPLLFAVYVLAWAMTIAGGLLASVLTGNLLWLVALLSAPVAPLLFVAFRRSRARGKLHETIPLTALYVVYGAARAASLLDLRNLREQPKTVQSADSQSNGQHPLASCEPSRLPPERSIYIPGDIVEVHTGEQRKTDA